jgi:DNA-binding response OmpR family regulator
MSALAAQNRWINFDKVSLLALDQSIHGCKILAQIVRGFGIRMVRTCTSSLEAKQALQSATFDLMIADPSIEGEEGVALLRWLRRQDKNKNRFVPIILISGHSTPALVRRSRDCGANFFVAKPLTPSTLLERILWVSRDTRPFVEVGEYLGPDRRFKVEAPPEGPGRRGSDAEVTVSDDDVSLGDAKGAGQ